MPIYEYQCKACGEIHEALQKISDAPLVDCPACGKAELKKNVTAAAFRLKGGGWYETDFKSGNKKNLAGEQAPDGGGKAKADGGESSGKSEKSDTGSTKTAAKDSKPAAGKASGGSSGAS
jgi:putative FmdB family regulatory protein